MTSSYLKNAKLTPKTLHNKTIAREYYSRLRREGRLTGTITRAVELWSARRDARRRGDQDRRQCYIDGRTGARYFRSAALPLEAYVRIRCSATAIPLGSKAESVSLEGRQLRPRAKNWVGAAADCVSKDVRVIEVDCGKYSNASPYTRYEYRPQLRSCGVCSPGQLHYWFGSESRRLKAPRGWQFGRDGLGLYIARNREKRVNYRYHFSASDLSSAGTLRAAAIAHEARQKRAANVARERAILARENSVAASKTAAERDQVLADGYVFVGLHDSSRAGNCAAGTQAWARQRGMDPAKRYPARVILRAAGADSYDLEGRHGVAWKVQRAVESAIDRTLVDLHRGYCTIRLAPVSDTVR